MLTAKTLITGEAPETSLPRKAAAGVRTRLERAEKSSRWNRKLLGTAAVVGALQPTFQKLLAEHGGRLEEVEKKLRADNPDFAAVLNSAASRVFVVIYRDADGQESNLGTAWVVGDGVLATNAHVAEPYLRRGPNEEFEHWADFEFLVRSKGPDPREFRIVSAEMHPGFDSFGRLWRKYWPGRRGAGGKLDLSFSQSTLLNACDVGLLRVEEGADLGPALDLASEGSLHALAPGEVIGYVGYPSENMQGGGFNVASPTPTMQMNIVTAVTDYLLRPADYDRALLIQHGLPGAGGCSGSPIFNRKGEVVALFNAGNAVLAHGRRISTGVGVNFAQRVDLVRELLDGTAEELNAARLERWQAAVESFESLREELAKERAAWRGEMLRQAADLVWRQGYGEPRPVLATDASTPPAEPGKPAHAQVRWIDVEIPHAEVGAYVALIASTGTQSLTMKLLDEKQEQVHLTGPDGKQGPPLRVVDQQALFLWSIDRNGLKRFLRVAGPPESEAQVHVHYCPPMARSP